MARVAAIVLNWRRPLDTVRCVSSLIALGRDLDIIVLDNDSGDGSLGVIESGLAAIIAGRPGVAFIQTGHNGGYAFGNNVGIRVALERQDCEFVWILNNDTVVPGPASLDALCARMDADPSIGICGSTVVFADRPGIVQSLGGGTFNPLTGRCRPIGLGDPLSNPIDQEAVERRLAYVSGAAAFVRRAYVEAVGPMTEDYFLYYEEIDWAWRGKDRFRLGYAADSVVFHAVGASIGTDDFGNSSAASRYYFARSTLKFLARRWAISLPIGAAMLVREALAELLRGRWRNAEAIGLALAGQPLAEHCSGPSFRPYWRK